MIKSLQNLDAVHQLAGLWHSSSQLMYPCTSIFRNMGANCCEAVRSCGWLCITKRAQPSSDCMSGRKMLSPLTFRLLSSLCLLFQVLQRHCWPFWHDSRLLNRCRSAAKNDSTWQVIWTVTCRSRRLEIVTLSSRSRPWLFVVWDGTVQVELLLYGNT